MEGVPRCKVRLLPHNPAWDAEFCTVKSELERLWGENILDVQQVGSTAIPSIVAKPILDVAVLLRSIDAMDHQALEALGYDYLGHHGGGWLYVLRSKTGDSLRHIHCYPASDPDFARQVAFRDYLLAHPEAAAEYQQMKCSLLEQFADDRGAYTKGKTEFIMRCLNQAALNP